jgi:hypothetical protein
VEKTVSEDKLNTLFYILLRDYLTFGQIEEIFKSHIDKVNSEPEFSEEQILVYVKSLTERMKTETCPPEFLETANKEFWNILA